MKIYLSFLFLLLPFLLISQTERVGINTSLPSTILHVNGESNNDDHLIYARVNWSGAFDVKALEGHSVPQAGFGIGIFSTGGYKGVYGFNPGGNYGGTSYGVHGNATGTAGIRVGVFGSASGGSTNLAGKFGAGDVLIENDLRVGTSANTGRAHIRNQNKVFGSNATAMRVESSHNGSQSTYGLLVSASNSGTGATYGVFSTVSNTASTASAYGLYTRALDTKDWGLYSIGRNYISGDLRINTQDDPYNGIYALIVNGRIISEEVLIQNSNSWPDYVFDESYKLMPLKELEKSIKANHHLPNIPPASQMEEEGIPIGEIQIKMMEKIEELTLYILQQQKEIDGLKSAMHNLANQNETGHE